MTILTSYSDARQKLASLLDRVTEDLEIVVIQRRGRKNAVLVDEAEFSSLQETAYLLSSPANAARLFAAMNQLEQGQGVHIESIEALKTALGLDNDKA
jgi:antitoxin YefM